MRNNFYYVLLVVPIQTALALALAVLVHTRALKGRGFFRTAFYFPSVTSAVAITVLWLFLFSSTGAVNAILGWVGIDGPNWFGDARGLVHPGLGAVGVDTAPAALTDHRCSASAGGSGSPGRRSRCPRYPARGVHHLGHLHAAVHRRPATTSATRSRRPG